MRKISSLMIALLSLVLWGCAETEQPYVGYVKIEWRGILDANAGATTTVNADTDITSGIEVESIDFGDSESQWCTAEVSGTGILVTATEANTGSAERTATVHVRVRPRCMCVMVIGRLRSLSCRSTRDRRLFSMTGPLGQPRATVWKAVTEAAIPACLPRIVLRIGTASTAVMPRACPTGLWWTCRKSWKWYASTSAAGIMPAPATTTAR